MKTIVRLALCAGVIVASACGSDTPTEPPLSGLQFALTSINGTPTPATEDGKTCSRYWADAHVGFNENSVGFYGDYNNSLCNGSRLEAFTWSGSYEMRGDSIIMSVATSPNSNQRVLITGLMRSSGRVDFSFAQVTPTASAIFTFTR